MRVVSLLLAGLAGCASPALPGELGPIALGTAPLCEASSLTAWAPQDRFLVSDNEDDRRLFTFRLEQGRLREPLTLALPAGTGPQDVEAIAADGPLLLIVGSHDRRGDCTVDPNRRLIRVLEETGGALVERALFDHSSESWTQSGPACLAERFVTPAPEGASELCDAIAAAEASARAPDCRSLAIEGAAYIAGRAWLGLRRPVVAGRAALIRLDELGRFDAVRWLELGGRGVRALAPDGGAVLGVAAHDDGTAAVVFEADLETSSASVLRESYEGSEGIALAGDTALASDTALVVTDGAASTEPSRCERSPLQARLVLQRTP